jgi:hypothetical protein
MAIKVDIVIRSYYRDLEWLRYCLRSIDRFCSGFHRVLVVVPESCRERIRRSPLDGVEVAYCPNYPDDYLGQQVTKLYADTMSEADYILHVDSDCTFKLPVRPADFFWEGRPQLMITPNEFFRINPPWQRETERTLGFAVNFDYMRRHPHIYPRWLYGELRAHVRAHHGRELADYVLAQPPQGFSEFNAMGALAHHRFSSEFSWEKWLSSDYDEKFCRIHWSWGGLTPEIREELEAILANSGPSAVRKIKGGKR